jgi:sugar phosphate isomerase/epimerase
VHRFGPSRGRSDTIWSKGQAVIQDRRSFVKMLAAGALGARVAPLAATAKTTMRLAYTSFWTRLQQDRDLGAPAPRFDVFQLLRLCEEFGASGVQVELSMLPTGDAASLSSIRASCEQKGIALELSLPSSAVETPEAYAHAVSVARAVGADRARVALLSGRRYETFDSRAAWAAFASKWRDTLPRMRAEFDRHRLDIGIENHKDWLAAELVALIRSIGSAYVGACVDFGNNIALLENPDDTIAQLAPYAVTTHVKDMAVRETGQGFELSEVPLGEGFLPLGRYIETIRRHRPKTSLCLEMITRDPLVVPYKTDRYWAPFDEGARAAARTGPFEARVLSKAARTPLPRTSGLDAAERQRAENDHVRASLAYASGTLKLAR